MTMEDWMDMLESGLPVWAPTGSGPFAVLLLLTLSIIVVVSLARLLRRTRSPKVCTPCLPLVGTVFLFSHPASLSLPLSPPSCSPLRPPFTPLCSRPLNPLERLPPPLFSTLIVCLQLVSTFLFLLLLLLLLFHQELDLDTRWKVVMADDNLEILSKRSSTKGSGATCFRAESIIDAPFDV